MGIFEVTLQQEYFGQKVINRWNYVSTGEAPSLKLSFALLESLGFLTLPPLPEAAQDMFSIIRTLQNDQVFSQLVSCSNIYSDTDFYARAYSNVPGVQVGETSASFIAFGFRTNQVTKKVRPGQKRLVGVRDNDTTDGGNFTSATDAQMALVASAMSEARIYDPSGANITFTPAICAREKYVTPSGGTAYRYYGTEAEQLANTAVGIQWTPKATVRSQVSRQIGRGG